MIKQENMIKTLSQFLYLSKIVNINVSENNSVLNINEFSVFEFAKYLSNNVSILISMINSQITKYKTKHWALGINI